MTDPRLTLLAFPPMINVETTRCVLKHYGISYREVDRLLGWANIRTFFHGGYGEVPILYGPGVRLSGPYPIVRRFDVTHGQPRLLPLDQPLRGAWRTGFQARPTTWAATTRRRTSRSCARSAR